MRVDWLLALCHTLVWRFNVSQVFHLCLLIYNAAHVSLTKWLRRHLQWQTVVRKTRGARVPIFLVEWINELTPSAYMCTMHHKARLKLSADPSGVLLAWKWLLFHLIVSTIEPAAAFTEWGKESTRDPLLLIPWVRIQLISHEQNHQRKARKCGVWYVVGIR